MCNDLFTSSYLFLVPTPSSSASLPMLGGPDPDTPLSSLENAARMNPSGSQELNSHTGGGIWEADSGFLGKSVDSHILPGQPLLESLGQVLRLYLLGFTSSASLCPEKALQERVYYYPHFPDEETEIQRDEVTYPRPTAYKRKRWGLKPGRGPRACASPHSIWPP